MHNGWRGLILVGLSATYLVHPLIPPIVLSVLGVALLNEYAYRKKEDSE